MKDKLFLGALVLVISLILPFGVSANSLENKPEKEKSPIVTLSASNYKEETSKGLVFVDFWAAWCGPCRRIAPMLDDLAKEYKESVKIGKLNVDNYKKFAIEQGVEVLPTIVIYKDGKEVTRVKGVVSKDKLVEIIKAYSSQKD